MSRSPRRSPTPSAGASGRTPRAFDELASLRRELVERAQQAPAKSTPRSCSPAPKREANDADESPDLEFRRALGDVTPLRDDHRAEIETPKPPPVPRPREPEPPPEPAAARPERLDRLEGAPLFRAAMQDVQRIRHDDLADVGRADPHRRHYWPESEGALPAARPDDGELRLPSDVDADNPADLFRYVTRGAQPLADRNRVESTAPPPAPRPLKRSEDERSALRESMEAPLSLEDRLEMGDEAAFLRPGLPKRVLLDLRRGRWVLQGEVDLHGYTRDEARTVLSQFLATSLNQGRRCVRVIHGKGLGSPGRESILKKLSRGWLAQREEILAFCQAGPYDGGEGALLVLLRAQTANRPQGAAGD